MIRSKSDYDPGQRPTYGCLDEALIRPPLVLGCERLPLVITIATVAFSIIVIFGLTFTGLVAGVLLAIAIIALLRRVAAYDPYFFAVYFEASKYPRVMPDVLPPENLPIDLPFVGYDDPPTPKQVLTARALYGTVIVGGVLLGAFGIVIAFDLIG